MVGYGGNSPEPGAQFHHLYTSVLCWRIHINVGSPVFMYNSTITFDELPGAVSSLVNLVRELADEVWELRVQLTSERGKPKSNTKFIGLAEACEILGKAKSQSTVLQMMTYWEQKGDFDKTFLYFSPAED